MNKKTYITKKLRLLSFCIGTIIVLSTIIILVCYNVISKDQVISSHKLPNVYYMNYNAAALDDSEKNKIIKYGFELFQNTAKHIGPESENPELSYAGNRLSCNNCHLNSGTKPYSAPLIGIIQRFPQFRGRENKMGTIEERINGCFERSMNGIKLHTDSKEMKAYVAYLEYLSRYAPEDGEIEGQGFLKLKIPERAIDLEHGKKVFITHCIICHQSDGQGIKSANGFNYEYPPLWGNDSYNDGAGMTRVLTSARFIKANMPFGTTYDSPFLTDEEAYDVAGFINQQQRPIKSHPEKDFPDIKKKPVSTPYPPYADNFSIDQHQKGPFQPIIEYYKNQYNIIKTK
ncbi:cytochrome C [Flavobacteriales bacterium 34_180_T64]|mgnify:CR=1 FL=1|nr:cytochrome C [Flavobacteriales bacterium 34_180_T64]